MTPHILHGSVDAPRVAARYPGRRCAVAGCDCRTLVGTTEYCATHYQELVSKSRLRKWLRQRRAAGRKRS